MRILLDKVSKRFNHNWLFKDLDYHFQLQQSYAITGPNGSGKSTLLKILAGMIPVTKGIISYQESENTIDPDNIYQFLSFCAPYMEVPEELSLMELMHFHFELKQPSSVVSIEEIASNAGLYHALHKPIHTFSSGMKQRVKLALSIYATTPILLMDEPTTNLDESGVTWYLDEIQRIKSSKLLIIGSNQTFEYDFCNNFIKLGEVKSAEAS